LKDSPTAIIRELELEITKDGNTQIENPPFWKSVFWKSFPENPVF